MFKNEKLYSSIIDKKKNSSNSKAKINWRNVNKSRSGTIKITPSSCLLIFFVEKISAIIGNSNKKMFSKYITEEKETSMAVSNSFVIELLELRVFFEAMYSLKDAHPAKKSAEDAKILISKCSTGKLNNIMGYKNK